MKIIYFSLMTMVASMAYPTFNVPMMPPTFSGNPAVLDHMRGTNPWMYPMGTPAPVAQQVTPPAFNSNPADLATPYLGHFQQMNQWLRQMPPATAPRQDSEGDTVMGGQVTYPPAPSASATQGSIAGNNRTAAAQLRAAMAPAPAVTGASAAVYATSAADIKYGAAAQASSSQSAQPVMAAPAGPAVPMAIAPAGNVGPVGQAALTYYGRAESALSQANRDYEISLGNMGVDPRAYEEAKKIADSKDKYQLFADLMSCATQMDDNQMDRALVAFTADDATSKALVISYILQAKWKMHDARLMSSARAGRLLWLAEKIAAGDNPKGAAFQGAHAMRCDALRRVAKSPAATTLNAPCQPYPDMGVPQQQDNRPAQGSYLRGPNR